MNNQSNITLSRSNLAYNLAAIRKLVGKNDTLCACIKANAYGHGLYQVLPELLNNKLDWFAVHTINEAAKVRDISSSINIIILGPINKKKDYIAAYKLRARFFIYNLEQLNAYSNFIKTKKQHKHPVHLKINTGLNRLGINEDEIKTALKLIKVNDINLEGIATHFATADVEPNNTKYKQQLALWQNIAKQITSQMDIKYVHAANSSTILKGLGPEVGVMHRPGMAIYGLSPVVSQRKALKPILRWEAEIVHINTIQKGETVSYGATWRARRKTTLAVIPIGYYDGLDRGLSNCGQVLINNTLCPIIGRICMDMTMIDITDLKQTVKVGQAITIIDDNQVSAYNLASMIDTIPYEVLARLNPISINRSFN